jgi:hypothetical protein
MALSKHQRQKKLQAKRTQRKVAAQRKLSRMRLTGIHARMESATSWPVVQARVSHTIWKNGLGQALLARRGPNGLTVMAVFLLDVYCLGVKDVITRADPELVAGDWMAKVFSKNGPWVDVSAEHIRKLVEESIGYALSLGIAPHPECATAQLIFGDLDSSKCSQDFTFGRNGKPLFISGPHDNSTRVHSIMSMLRQSCGVDGFHFVLPMGSDGQGGGLEELVGLPNENMTKENMTKLDEFEDDDV